MDEILGPRVVSKEGEVATREALAGKKVIGLYFSAHWCGPCRSFTPELVAFYAEEPSLEIIFVSRDSDEKSMLEYYETMPWLRAVDPESLCAKYHSKGIPQLILLEPTGQVITTEGRAGVIQRPGDFPWRPKGLPDFVLSKKGKVALPTSPLFLYFSGHWCPPCRGFTPQLAAFYNRLKEKAEFDVVFISSDKSQQDFDEYYEEMPWLALPWGDPLKDELSAQYDIKGIPTLILLDSDRKVITTAARNNVVANEIDAFPRWEPKPYADLTTTIECNGMEINEAPALVVLAEKTPNQQAVVDAVKAVALKNTEKMLFFYGISGAGGVGRVRMLLQQAPTETPVMIMLDIPDDGAYYKSDATDITVSTITAFLNNPGPRLQLGA